jgi:2-methylcitrate dehydratase PrpD
MTVVASRSVAEELAEFVSSLDYADLPPDVVHQAKLSTLDFIGVALAGSETPSGQVIADYVRTQGGSPQSTIFGTSVKVPRAQAVLANGTIAHSVELDDHEAHSRSKVHPGVAVMPAAWAVTETNAVSGKDFLTSVVVGYDVIGRLSAATSYPDFLGRERGFHTTGLFGPFSAGAVAGRLLGLDAGQISHAFGILGSLCSGLSETMDAGSWTKRLHAGWACHSGMVAAELAVAGFTGPRTVFEGRRGFYNAFCGAGNFDLDVVGANFGREFDISLIMYKPYACAGGIHSAMAAVEQIRASTAFSASEIDEITVYCDPHVIETFVNPREAKYSPVTGAQAQFSLPFAVAVLIIDGVALVDQFTDDAVRRTEVLDLAQRIRCEPMDFPHESDEDDPARVTIKTTDGRILDATVPGAKGSLAVPMGTDDIVTKFRALAVPVVGEERAQLLVQTVLELEASSDVGHIPALLAGPSGDR